MKKLLGTTIAASLLFTGLTAGHEAEAAKANINYLSASNVAKAKAGTLSMDGFKIGSKASTYINSRKYNKDGTREFSKEYLYSDYDDRAFVDFQSSVSGSKRVITRIVDKRISSMRIVERGEVLAKYGKPLMTDVVTDKYGESKQVDMYKNITFFYAWDTDEDKAPILDGVVIMHNKTKSAQQKWFDYATGEADYSVDGMLDYITSSEWAAL